MARIIIYRDSTGEEHFMDWLYGIKNPHCRRRILVRLRRLEQGNAGDCKPLREGIFELRLFFGPGFRIYYGQQGDALIVLLCGGDKSSQRRDIKRAIKYWIEYKRNA